jgi:hypothetical protein
MFLGLSGIGGGKRKYYTFGEKDNQPLSTPITSNTISIKTGGTVHPDTGLTWSKNGGAFSAADGTVVAGDKVQVKETSSGSYSTPVTLNLTINGVAFPFVAVTMTEPVILEDITFGGDTVTMGGETAAL